MGIFGFLEKVAENGRKNTLLALIFQQNTAFARLAQKNLERCLRDRGKGFDQSVMIKAQLAITANPNITMGEFIEHYL